jgi:hypothetical protein
MPRGPETAALWLAAAVALASPAGAQEMPDASHVVPAAYAAVAAEVSGRIDFEETGRIAEPGMLVEGLYSHPGGRIGERFTGQALLVARDAQGGRFDALSGQPTPPLQVRPGAPGETLSLAHHRGLGSMAAFALGPAGFPDIAARGEGALAVRFAVPQRATGLRLHAGYPDPLGARPAPGAMVVTFYAADGRLLGRSHHALTTGAMAFAWRFPQVPVAGITLTTTDPGGLAVDDILFAPALPTS